MDLTCEKQRNLFSDSISLRTEVSFRKWYLSVAMRVPPGAAFAHAIPPFADDPVLYGSALPKRTQGAGEIPIPTSDQNCFRRG